MPRSVLRPGVMLAAMLLAGATANSAPARADIITVPDMVRGINKTAEQCAVVPQAVWISALGHSYCIRYYLAPGANDQRKAVVFLQGDRLGVLNLRTGNFAVPDGERDINTDDLMRFATILAKETKITAIYLARVGVEGSSGDHRVRHSVLELEATNAALDAIKKQYNLEGFHLLGQSGGAHLVAGLLGMRDDINCAVIGSGPLAPVRRPNLDDPALEHFNPASKLEAIVRNRKARIMVVTDPSDRKVNGDRQTQFVRMLQQAGRAAEQYIVQAIDENRHGVLAYSRVALAGCLRGASADEIAQQVEKVVQQRVAASKPRLQNRNDGSRDVPTGLGEGHGHPTGSEPSARQTPAPERAPETTHRDNTTSE